MKNPFGPLRFRYGILCLLVSVAAALIAYGIGKSLRAKFESSGSIRVVLVAENGVSDPNVTATNDLATQYAQLVGSTSIAQLTATRLNVPVAEVTGVLSGSTVGAQNVLQVTASASTPSVAAARAAAATRSVQLYLERSARDETRGYLSAISSGLAGLQKIKGAPPGTTAALYGAKAQAFALSIRDAAGSTPGFQIIDPSSAPSQSSPKPTLYALVAFVVALILAGRIAFVAMRSQAQASAG